MREKPLIASAGESGRKGVSPKHFARISFRSSSLLSAYVNLLWPFVPVAIILHFVRPQHHKAIFATSFLAVVPSANLIGFAGQQLARKLPTLLGVLTETLLGGSTEIVLFIVLIAKSKNNDLMGVIQAAILGSILANLLLCLGSCFVVGGLRHLQKQEQTFHAAVSEIGSGLLLVAGFALLLPTAFFSSLYSSTQLAESRYTLEMLHDDVRNISHATSIVLIISFFVFIIYNAGTHDTVFSEILEHDETRDVDREKDLRRPRLTMIECILALIIALALVSLLTVFLVIEIEPMVEEGVPDAFIGLILLPLVEKLAEHLTAIDEAYDDQMNLALFHCLCPSIQTALFNGPLTVIVAWGLGKDLTLNFEVFFIILLVLAILVVGNFLRDGKSNYLEGFLCISVYTLIAVAAWYYPNPSETTTNTLAPE